MHELPELPELPTLATFSPHVGQKFRLAQEGGEALEMELVEAEALRSHPGAPRQDPFSLVFRGPPGVNLGQGMQTLTHPETGEVALFLVPVGQSGQSVLYQAVFN
jgi:hypothetical protein